MVFVCVVPLCRAEDPVPDELKEWKPSVLLGSIFGLMFGGLIGARWSADKFIAMNHNTKFPSVMQAQVGDLVPAETTKPC